MKAIALSVILAFFFTGDIIGQQQVKLTVVITNIKVFKGNMEISLYNSKKSFPLPDGYYQTQSVPVKNDTVSCDFIVEEGYYAIALYHDINSNKKCDNNVLGIPVEPFAFSNDVRPVLSAPSFSSAKFKVKDETVIFIRLPGK